MALFGKGEKTTDKELEELSKYSSHITKGTTFKGDIETMGSIRVDGRVIGNIYSKSKVVLGETAVVEGNIHAQNVEVEGGEQIGNLDVSELLILRPKAHIKGNIVTGKMVVESGALFNGSCKMGTSGSAQTEQAPVYAENALEDAK